MILLGIDTSVSLSIALYKNNILLEEIHDEKPHTASEKCAIYVHELLQKHSIDDIDYIALNVGPGSYTGLRVSLSIAKGLAFGKQTKLIAVTSMENLLFETENKIAILESKRDEVYISTDGITIKAILKDDLNKHFPNATTFITHKQKDFSKYLPHSEFHEKMITAKDLCMIAFTKINLSEFVENQNLDVIYAKPFSS